MRFTALAAALGALAWGACARLGAGRAPSPTFASPTIIAGSPTPRASDPMPPEEPADTPAPAAVPARAPAKAAKSAKPAKPRSDARTNEPRPAARRADASVDGHSTSRRSDARADDRTAPRADDRAASRRADDRGKVQPKTAIRAVSAAPIRVVSAAKPPASSRDDDDRGSSKPERRDDADRDRRSTSKLDRQPAAEADPNEYRVDADRDPSRPERRADAEPDHRRTDPSDRRSDADTDRRHDANTDRHHDADADDDAEPPAAEPERPALRAPHRGGEPQSPPLHSVADLRELVGRRDARDSFAAVAAWSRALGAPVAATSGPELLSWAAESHRLYPATEPPRPGDLLVFDQVASDDASDLVAIVVDRDERGVTELLYLGGGVVRRGLVDASRPAVHRDTRGATVNTYLRHGRRWPAKGMHYLAGELLAHVVRPR